MAILELSKRSLKGAQRRSQFLFIDTFDAFDKIAHDRDGKSPSLGGILQGAIRLMISNISQILFEIFKYLEDQGEQFARVG